jgi:methionyl-tRNA formyltransferase
MARILFLGTPEEAIPTLSALRADHEVGLVVTQPDRPKGRSKTPVPPQVKEYAIAHGLLVAQPEHRQQLLDVIEENGPYDVGVVVAYGRILQPELLEIPRHGLLNLHFSLLPRWRGAAPVNRALMAGDSMTGVTIIKLDQGLDTGPVLTAQMIDIPESDDAGALTNRLAGIGARLLAGVLPGYLAGEVVPVPQSDDGVIYAEKLEPGDRPIDPSSTMAQVLAQVRGLAPSPGATLDIDGTRHKVLVLEPSDETVSQGTWRVVDGRPLAGLGDGAVELVRLQAPGKNPMAGSAWARGLRREDGIIS